MKKIDFEKLIQLAPFDQETRNQILSQKDSLTQDQILALEETAWTMLAVVYQAKLKKIVDTSLGEMARGEKHYSRSDFAEMQAQLYIDFARQLEMSQAEEDIDVVKAELQKHLPKIPPTSPQT